MDETVEAVAVDPASETVASGKPIVDEKDQLVLVILRITMKLMHLKKILQIASSFFHLEIAIRI